MPLVFMGSFLPPKGMIRDQEIENRYELTPYDLRRAISSLYRRYESVAVSPVPPSRVLPGVRAKSSQMDLPRPSAFNEPSIWYAAGYVVSFSSVESGRVMWVRTGSEAPQEAIGQRTRCDVDGAHGWLVLIVTGRGPWNRLPLAERCSGLYTAHPPIPGRTHGPTNPRRTVSLPDRGGLP